MNTTFDPKKVNVSCAGRAITGFANDGVITLSHNADGVTPSIGAQGDVVYTHNADNSGNAALTLQSTSSSLAFLRQLAAKRQPFTFSVSDANDDDSFHVNEQSCRILKMPDTPRTREASSVTVNIHIPSLNYR